MTGRAEGPPESVYSPFGEDVEKIVEKFGRYCNKVEKYYYLCTHSVKVSLTKRH